ncbi:MAG: arsenic resistance N-acetyltransferase ArsN2 [Steroidobacteraceae bacterium]
MTSITKRPALNAAIELLRRAQLPTDDLTETLMESFFVAGDPAAPLGIVGLDLSPPHALLRSLAVDACARRHGLGAQLLAHAEQHARGRGVREVYLLTTTAEPFFAARGYARTEREQAPAFIRSSAEFSTLCPASAAFMLKHL